MYKSTHKQNSSFSPISIQKKTNGSDDSRSFSVQPKPEINSSQEQEIPSYSRNAADCLSTNVMRSMEQEKDSDEMSLEAEVQTKLTVGAVGDQYEQEADQVAAQVMSMSVTPDASPQVQRFEEEDNLVQKWSLAQSITPVVQRQVDEQVQMRSLVQRAFQAGANQASEDLESRLNASKGGGSALAPEVRAFMEPRFGADFSSVRVHTSGEAVQMNRELGAQAFAHGSDVYFGAGKSPGNNELTAHELTHVVQQTGKQITDSGMAAVEHKTVSTVAQREIIQRDGDIERPVNSIDLSPIAPNANKVKEAASKILDVATTVRKAGEHWYGDEKDKLNMAANLTDMASKMTSAASAMENITRGLDGGKLEGSAEVLDKATKLLRAADFLASVNPNHPSLVAFKNDPNDFTKAADWANHIGDIFGKASELIPDSIPGLPGFIPQYFKGLLSAPKNYIQVFIALQQDRIRRIDSETGGSSAKERVSEGDRSVWEGPLSKLFYGAFFVEPRGLQDLMIANRNIAGKDLWKTSQSYGKALILGAVQGIADENKRQLWSNYINGS
jgi:hypothetical protein